MNVRQLASAQRLEDLQSLDRFGDEASEAELAREVTLLERER
jgi:hypothetical protein